MPNQEEFLKKIEELEKKVNEAHGKLDNRYNLHAKKAVSLVLIGAGFVVEALYTMSPEIMKVFGSVKWVPFLVQAVSFIHLAKLRLQEQNLLPKE